VVQWTWFFWRNASAEEQERQLKLQAEIVAAREGYRIGERCFISTGAAVQNSVLELGDSSYIAAHVNTSGTLRTGRNCTLNPFCVIRGGTITLGDPNVEDGLLQIVNGFYRLTRGTYAGSGCPIRSGPSTPCSLGFQAPHPSRSAVPATHPGLQGTEMWLAINWLLADLVGLSGLVGYRPRASTPPSRWSA